MHKLIISAYLTAVLSAFVGLQLLAAEPEVLAPVPALDAPLAKVHGTASAILSGGCFWGMQGVFQHVKGVKEAVSGYTGGTADTARYEIVSTGTTGQMRPWPHMAVDASTVRYLLRARRIVRSLMGAFFSRPYSSASILLVMPGGTPPG